MSERPIEIRLRELAVMLEGHSEDPSEYHFEKCGFLHPEIAMIGDAGEGEPSSVWADHFDTVVMRCNDCDWWTAACDLDDDGNCSSCRRESE